MLRTDALVFAMKEKERAVRISASLPESLWARVKERSETMGQSASWQLKQALTQWLDEQEKAGR